MTGALRGGARRDVVAGGEVLRELSKDKNSMCPCLPRFMVGGVFVVLAVSSSVGLIIFNKWLFTSGGFPYPVLLTTWHMLLSTVLTQFMFQGGLIAPTAEPINAKTFAKQILPVGVMNSVALLTGNWAYLYLSVAFFQMIKKASVMTVLVLSFLFGLKEPSWKLVGVTLLISAGVSMTIVGEIDMSLVGLILALTCMVTNSLKMVLINLLMTSKGMKLSSMQMLQYFAPACFVCNLGIFFILEMHKVDTAAFTGSMVGVLLANGLVAFMLNIFTMFAIRHTSAYVMTLGGIGKDFALISFSVTFFGSHVTSLQILGYVIALVGMLLVKAVNASKKKEAAAAVAKGETERLIKPAGKACQV